MTQIIKETTVPGSNVNPVMVNPVVAPPVRVGATSFQTIEYLVYFFFGVLEALLAFRLVLKLAGASIASTFVGFIYGFTGLFIAPFEGIFRKGLAPGVETTSVFEPSTIVAIIVYAAIAWGIVKLVQILSGEQQAY